jgi:hypothetical protein
MTISVPEYEVSKGIEDDEHGRKGKRVRVRWDRKWSGCSSSTNNKKAIQNIRTNDIPYGNFGMSLTYSCNSRHELGSNGVNIYVIEFMNRGAKFRKNLSFLQVSSLSISFYSFTQKLVRGLLFCYPLKM